MFGETDRFLEEVILSRRPQHGNRRETKNDFLPKKPTALHVVGELSLQDLSNNEISILGDSCLQHAQPKALHECDKTVNCSCGCEDECLTNLNRTQHDLQ